MITVGNKYYYKAYLRTHLKTVSLATTGKADYLLVLATARIITLQTDL